MKKKKIVFALLSAAVIIYLFVLTGNDTKNMKPLVNTPRTPWSETKDSVYKESKGNRFFLSAQNKAEEKDIKERTTMISVVLSEAKRMARLSENKTADSVINLLSYNSVVCMQDAIGLRLVQKPELKDEGVGIIIFRYNEKIIFPQWRVLRNNSNAGALYDRVYNCILLKEDTLYSLKTRALNLLHEGNHARINLLHPTTSYTTSEWMEAERDMYMFENDVMRGMFGTHYSALVEREADMLKESIDIRRARVGDYYPSQSRYAAELSDFLGPVKSIEERQDRELKLWIYATYDLIDRYFAGTDEDKAQEKTQFITALYKSKGAVK